MEYENITQDKEGHRKVKETRENKLFLWGYKRGRHVVLKEAMTTAAELAGQRSRGRGET